MYGWLDTLFAYRFFRLWQADSVSANILVCSHVTFNQSLTLCQGWCKPKCREWVFSHCVHFRLRGHFDVNVWRKHNGLPVLSLGTCFFLCSCCCWLCAFLRNSSALSMAFPASSSLPLDKPLTMDSAGKTNVLQLSEHNSVPELTKCIPEESLLIRKKYFSHQYKF